MKSLLISLPDEAFARARIAAAQEGKSLTRFITDLLDHRLGRRLTQREALERFLSGPPMPGAGAGFNRDDCHAERTRERNLLRRYQHPALPEGSSGPGEAGGGDALGVGARIA